MRSLLAASLASLSLASTALSGCASPPAGGDASAVSEIADPSLSQALVGEYRPADGGFPRLTLADNGTYVYDTGIRCISAPCPSGDAGTWRLTWGGWVRLRATSPDALEPQRFVDIASSDPVTLMVEDASGETHELAKVPPPSLAGEYRPADGGYPRLTLADDGTYVYDTGIRCFRAPCPSGDAGTWQAVSGDAVQLSATSPGALEPQRTVEVVSSDPLVLTVDDAFGEACELTPFVAPPPSCAAVLCAPGTHCEVIDGAAQCAP